MKIDLRQPGNPHVRCLTVDPDNPPALVRAPDAEGVEHELYLDWDRTLDDEGYLRHCPVCGCAELFRMRGVPLLNGFVVVLVFGLLELALYGLAGAPLGLVLGALAAVTVANVLIYFFSPSRLGCYGCGSEYRAVPIASRHAPWDSSQARKYRRVDVQSPARLSEHTHGSARAGET